MIQSEVLVHKRFLGKSFCFKIYCASVNNTCRFISKVLQKVAAKLVFGESFDALRSLKTDVNILLSNLR